MRLGFNWKSIERESELQSALPIIDELGLGAIAAPDAMLDWSIKRCEEFGEMVRSYGLTIGEFGYWENLLVEDPDARDEHIETVRDSLRKADAMGVDCVVTLVGTHGGSWAGAPHADNWTEDTRAQVIENCNRILDGMSLDHTSYVLEPWFNSFFYKPKSVHSLLNEIDHPDFGVHMDIMNMHDIGTVYRSTELINRAFDLLSGDIVSAHAKDVAINNVDLRSGSRGFVLLEEVLPGDGTMDYDCYMNHLDDQPDDFTVFTEHWETEEEYIETMQRLRRFAERNDIELVDRSMP